MISNDLLKEFLSGLNIDIMGFTKDFIKKFGGFYSNRELAILEIKCEGISELINEINDVLELQNEEKIMFMSLTLMFIDFLYYKNIVNEFIDNTIEKRKILIYFLNSSVENNDNMIDVKTRKIPSSINKDVILLLGALYVFSLYSGEIVLTLETFITKQDKILTKES